MAASVREKAWIGVLVLGAALVLCLHSANTVVSFAAYYTAGLTSVGALFLAASRRREPEQRPWLFLASGVSFFVIGHFVWDVVVIVDTRQALAVLVSSPFYIASLGLVSAAFLDWASRERGGTEKEDSIDAVIVTLGFAILSWIFIIGPNLHNPIIEMSSDIGATAFATFTLFPLALLLRIALRTGMQHQRALGLFIIGGMIWTVAESFYGWGKLTDSTSLYKPLADTGQMLWFTVWASAALDPSSIRIDTPQARPTKVANPSNGKRIAILTVAALIAPVSIVLGVLENRPLDTILVAAATIALFGLVIYRMVMVVNSLEAALTTQQQLQNELSLMAYRDTLTGLPNRAYLNEEFGKLLEQRSAAGFIVLFLDLDNFKEVNDRYGHAAGDLLLVEVARRLEGCARKTDIVSRLGGDEFVIILDLQGQDARTVAPAAAQRILSAVVQPALIAGVEVTVSASIGVACPQNDSASSESILGAADRAMYAAKQAGKNQNSFAPDSLLADSDQICPPVNRIAYSVWPSTLPTSTPHDRLSSTG